VEGSEAETPKYLKTFYQHVPVMDAGARDAAMTFMLEEIGDVPLTLENEAIREVAEARGMLQIVYPPVSILAEPYVAWVDANVARDGTLAIAQAYLQFLFTDQAQATIARHGYRPYKQSIANNIRPKRPKRKNREEDLLSCLDTKPRSLLGPLERLSRERRHWCSNA